MIAIVFMIVDNWSYKDFTLIFSYYFLLSYIRLIPAPFITSKNH